MATSWTPPPLPPRLRAMRGTPLVGRRRALEALDDAWASVEQGDRQVVLVGGEPGAGKTRLAAEIAGVLHDDDIAVLAGAASVDAGTPYQPFTELLDALFRGTEPGALSDLLDDSAHQLARLSSHLDRHLDAPRDPDQVQDVRTELFDAVTTLLRALSAQRPLAVVLEDLHWAHRSTLAMLTHVIRTSFDVPLLVLATFRTMTPEHSDELVMGLADLHRLQGVRRIDLGGLDTAAIADFVSGRTDLTPRQAQAPAAILHDRTGGNPFFLHELWPDLERRGGVAALRTHAAVPASIGDTVAQRLSALGDGVRQVIEVAAVLGNSFELSTLVEAADADRAESLAAVDAATTAGLIDTADDTAGVHSFVHALTREAVLGRMAPSHRTRLHARVAESLEKRAADASVVPRLAHHYRQAAVLGYHDQALRSAREAGRLAERGLAFERAATWFQSAASLPDCGPEARAEMLQGAAANHLRAGDFAQARSLYEQLASTGTPDDRLTAAVGYEDANWRPGLADSRAADLLTTALADVDLPEDDPLRIRALGSLGRALAFAGQTDRARKVGTRAVELARELGDIPVIGHTLKTSLWHGLAPDQAQVQLRRSIELSRIAHETGDHEALGAASNFLAIAAYLTGSPADLEAAADDARRAAHGSGQPFFGYVAVSVMQGRAFLQGHFESAEDWANEALRMGDSFGVDTTEGPHGVEMFMIQRETGGLEAFREQFDGTEPLEGHWVPALLAIYVELGLDEGIERALDHLLNRDLAGHVAEAQWPLELAIMAEGALAVADEDAVGTLEPFLRHYEGRNLVSGQFNAIFGSADRYLARVAALRGDVAAAEAHFATALDMDRRMRSVVHTAETLAHHALFAADRGDTERAAALADEARQLAEPIGQRRVLRLLEALETPAFPSGLSGREVEVLQLVADGLSNREIGDELFISPNTAANHVRSILTKTGAANRTQAAIYAAGNDLL